MKNIQDNVVRIATGKSHVLALTHKGAMFGWGSNKYGQLAVEPAVQMEAKMPQLIAPDKKTKIQKIFAGKYHSMALGRNDVLYFWGSVHFLPHGYRMLTPRLAGWRRT